MKLDIRLRRDDHQFYLCLPAPPADDGSPQWRATALTPAEGLLWQRGDTEAVARRLRQRAWHWLMGWVDALLFR